MTTTHVTPLKLTLGEIAFAVATVDSYERAVGLIRTQIDVDRMEDALLLIQASAQSLHARDLATALTPTIELTPPVVHIGQVFARSQWLLRCSKLVRDDSSPTLLLHCSPAGVLAHEAVSEHVHKVAPVSDTRALLAQVDQLFGLSHIDRQVPSLQLPRSVFDAIVQLRDPREIEVQLLATARHTALVGPVREALANDLASPLWQGDVSWAHYPPGQAPQVGAAFHLFSGERSWLFEVTAPETVVISEATRQHLADATLRALERIPADQRRYQP